SGKMKNGKDLAGEMLSFIGSTPNPTYDKFEANPLFYSHYQIKKYADKLKDCVCLLLGCTRKDLENRVFKETELGPEWWVHEIIAESGFGKVLIPYTGSAKESHLTIKKLTPRMIFQLFGTQGGRMIVHPNSWVNSLFSDYKPTHEFPKWII